MPPQDCNFLSLAFIPQTSFLEVIALQADGSVCEEEEEEKTCRLCFGGEDDGPLVQPCACRGTAKFVHCSLGVR